MNAHDDNDDDFINYNIPKRKKTKRRKCVLKYKKTCAIYGIFDCNCCKKRDYNSVIDETNNQPSTSGVSTTSEDDREDIDVGTDCLPSTSTNIDEEMDKNNDIEMNENKNPQDIMEYVNRIYKESGYEEALNKEEEEPEIKFLNEINDVPVTEEEEHINNSNANATPPRTPEKNAETIEVDTSIKCEVLPDRERDRVPEPEEEEEEIDVVNIPPQNDETILTDNNNQARPEATMQQENNRALEIKIEFSDDENQIIDIINFDDRDCREDLLLNNNPPTQGTTNMGSTSNEDEIIDVENLIDDEQDDEEEEARRRYRRNRRRIKRRLMPHFVRVSKRSRLMRSVLTIDLINTSRDDSIIEITDSPVTVVPRKVTEVINVDDDDDDDGGKNEGTPTSSSHRIGLGNCPVCLENLAKKEIMSTICGHVYCARCIKNVIKTTKKCPNCRKNLTLKSIHPLFI